MSVDLPAPLPPTSPMTSPGETSRDTPSTAWTPPNDTRMSRISTAGTRMGTAISEAPGRPRRVPSAALPPARALAHVSLRHRRHRRSVWSMPTAATSTMPTAMSWDGLSNFMSCIPETSDWMMSAPSTAPGMVPMPPAKEVPPMTAAAMTDSSAPRPGRSPPTGGAPWRRPRPRRQDAHDDEGHEDHAPGVDAREDRRLRVAADREHERPKRRRVARMVMTSATPSAMSTGLAMPVGMMRPPGGSVMPCSSAYWVASRDGHG